MVDFLRKAIQVMWSRNRGPGTLPICRRSVAGRRHNRVEARPSTLSRSMSTPSATWHLQSLELQQKCRVHGLVHTSLANLDDPPAGKHAHPRLRCQYTRRHHGHTTATNWMGCRSTHPTQASFSRARWNSSRAIGRCCWSTGRGSSRQRVVRYPSQ